MHDMTDQLVNDAWTRRLEGSPLGEADRTLLADALSRDAKLSPRLLEDEAIDRALRVTCPADTGSFVASVIARVESLDTLTEARHLSGERDPGADREGSVGVRVSPRAARGRLGRGGRSAKARGGWPRVGILAPLAAAAAAVAITVFLQLREEPPAAVAPARPRDVAEAPPRQDSPVNEAPRERTLPENIPPEPRPTLGPDRVADADGDAAMPPEADDVQQPVRPGRLAVKPAEPPADRFADAAPAVNGPPLETVTSAVWKAGGPGEGGRLPEGDHELAEGTARVTALPGLEIDLEGPARIEVSGENLLRLVEGRMKAVAGPTAAVRIMTPSSVIANLDGSVAVDVDDVGDTLVEVVDGSAGFGTLGPGEQLLESVTLKAGERRRASGRAGLEKQLREMIGRMQIEGFGGAAGIDLLEQMQDMQALGGVGGGRSVSISTSTINGKFKGTIAVDGTTHEFDSRKAFDEARRRLREGKPLTGETDDAAEPTQDAAEKPNVGE